MSAHTLATVGLVATGVILVIFQSWLFDHLGLVSFLFTPGWLIFLWGRADAHFDTLYRVRKGILARITNPSIAWNGEFVLYDVHDAGALEQLRGWLEKRYPAETELIAESDHQLVLKLPFGVVRLERTSRAALSADLRQPEQPGSVLMIDFPHVGSGYRRAVAIADKHLVPFLDACNRIARPRTSTYVLETHFLEGNPYFGLYVRQLGRLDQTNIRFEIAFKETIGGRTQNVTVKQDRLTVAASDVLTFGKMVHTYLAVI